MVIVSLCQFFVIFFTELNRVFCRSMHSLHFTKVYLPNATTTRSFVHLCSHSSTKTTSTFSPVRMINHYNLPPAVANFTSSTVFLIGSMKVDSYSHLSPYYTPQCGSLIICPKCIHELLSPKIDSRNLASIFGAGFSFQNAPARKFMAPKICMTGSDVGDE